MLLISFTLSLVLGWTVATSGKQETNNPFVVTSNIQRDLHPPLSVRVIGGRFALPAEVPHQVAIYQGDEESSEITCGGSLIADSWVLTAAHCVWNDRKEELWVVVGRHNLSAPVKRIALQSVSSHGQFSGAHLTNDIALLKLAEPVSSLKTNARVIDLPREFEENNFQLASVSGFGDTRENKGKPSNRLKIASLIIRPNHQCVARYDHEFFPNMQLCAGLLRGTNDTCQGDSGGPLFAKRPDGSNVLLGVTSWGHGCGRRLTPGIYTRVSRYLTWIRRTINTYSD